LALDPNAKGEVHAFGVEAAYWFTPQLNVSLRYVKEYEGKGTASGRLDRGELYLDARASVLIGQLGDSRTVPPATRVRAVQKSVAL
jgi:hypothetical protein